MNDAEFVKLQPLPVPPFQEPVPAEVQKYKAFKKTFYRQEVARIAQVEFTRPSADIVRLAVASGTKVTLWRAGKEQGSLEHEGTLTKFKNLTTCTSWRPDGKLIMVGEAGGSCAVCEASTRKVLRRFRGQPDSVTCASFSSTDMSQAATGGKDGKLKIWDVLASEVLRSVPAHEDNLKFVASGFGGPNAWITAGYDGKVKLWDLRIGSEEKHAKCCLECDQGSPVEAGSCIAGGKLLATAGGQSVKVWDFAAGGLSPMMQIEGAHTKAITALQLTNDGSTLLSAGFDGFAKVHRLLGQSAKHIHTYSFKSPLSAITWRGDEQAFVVGREDGYWQQRMLKKSVHQEEAEEDNAEEAMAKAVEVEQRKRTWALRKADAVPADDDEVFEGTQKKHKKKERAIDFYFRKYEYRKVVSIITEPTSPLPESFAAIEELMQRGDLAPAFAELEEDLLEKVLQWLLRAFQSHAGLQQQLWFETMQTVLDNNRSLKPPAKESLNLGIKKLEEKVMREMAMAENMMEINSMLEVVLGL
mmetsp:Transcript_784/g.1681  ORF Transcript_784/g.1681 Transcript_784/m.1681 type:complete len:528 (+) Transcript_784:69-1652(+)